MSDGGGAADELHAVLAELTARLHDVVAEGGRAVAAVGSAWTDAAGRAWADSAQLALRALVREQDAATVLSDAVRHELLGRSDTDASTVPHLRGVGGARLGSTQARRVEEERGVHLARLGEEPP